MDIAVSFGAGVPVLTLTGRFDGAAAVVFDDRAGALETETAHWVLDFTGVTYLSSLGIRSLVSLETRLKAKDGCGGIGAFEKHKLTAGTHEH